MYLIRDDAEACEVLGFILGRLKDRKEGAIRYHTIRLNMAKSDITLDRCIARLLRDRYIVEATTGGARAFKMVERFRHL